VLRQKPEKLEDVHEQRKFINGMPQAIGALLLDIESTRVSAAAVCAACFGLCFESCWSLMPSAGQLSVAVLKIISCIFVASHFI
jgi:hypothetical protein